MESYDTNGYAWPCIIHHCMSRNYQDLLHALRCHNIVSNISDSITIMSEAIRGLYVFCRVQSTQIMNYQVLSNKEHCGPADECGSSKCSKIIYLTPLIKYIWFTELTANVAIFIWLVSILTHSCAIKATSFEVIVTGTNKATIGIHTRSIGVTRITETLINIWKRWGMSQIKHRSLVRL